MAEPIEIIIRKGSGGTGTGFGVPGANVSEQPINKVATTKPTAENKKDITSKAIALYSLNTLKREILFGISQYNNMRGNYINQAKFNVAMEMLNNVVSIAGAGVGGFIVGNAPGSVAAMITTSVGIALNYGNEALGLYGNILKINTYANIMQERSGNTYNNDSRGTYN